MTQTNPMPDLDLDFDSITEGYVRMGPIRRFDCEGVVKKMDLYGVFAFSKEAELLTEFDANGDLTITAIAEDVTGYFNSKDTNEAATSDTDSFLMSFLVEGETITVAGSYPDGMGGIIQTDSRFMRHDNQIYRDMKRSCIRSCGTKTEIMNLSEVREHELAALSANSGGNVVSLCGFRKARVA